LEIDELNDRCTLATAFINATVSTWSIDQTDSTLPVRFELWFPAILEQLEQENVVFDIPGRSRIENIRDAKLSKFPMESLYGDQPLSALFSLEAFIGTLDFSRLSHLKTAGSMFASPSSTAVYMMESQTWDVEAAAYLRHVVDQSIGKGQSNVPQYFPATVVEIDWVSISLQAKLDNAHTLSRCLRPYFNQDIRWTPSTRKFWRV
jgi:hypothetical protein